MRIALAFEHIRRLVGSHSQIVTELGRRLVARGHSVTIICDTVTDPEMWPELRFVARRAFKIGASHRPFLLYRWASRILPTIEHDVSLSFVSSIPADIVVPSLGLSPTRAIRPRGKVGRILGPADPRTWTSPLIDRRICVHPRVRMFVALSEQMADQLVTAHPGLGPRLRIIPGASPIDPPADDEVQAAMRRLGRKILNLEDDDLVFLWAAKSAGAKAGLRAIDAVAQLRNEGLKQVKLVMACEEPWPLHARAAQLGCDDGLRILSRTREMDLLWSAADVGLIPTANSNLGRAVWESLAFARPVITDRRMPGVDRIHDSEERVAGILVRTSDPDSLVTAMRTLATDQWELEAAIQSARDIRPSMRFDRFVDRMEVLMMAYCSTDSIRAVDSGRMSEPCNQGLVAADV